MRDEWTLSKPLHSTIVLQSPTDRFTLPRVFSYSHWSSFFFTLTLVVPNPMSKSMIWFPVLLPQRLFRIKRMYFLTHLPSPNHTTKTSQPLDPKKIEHPVCPKKMEQRYGKSRTPKWRVRWGRGRYWGWKVEYPSLLSTLTCVRKRFPYWIFHVHGEDECRVTGSESIHR